MDELKIFTNDEFGQVRAIEKDGQPWFIAKDICEILEIQNTTDALKRLDVDEVTRLNLGGLSGETNIINEYGLYSLILGSRKKEAKAFKRWITHEVIPSIRKHGAYVTDNVMDKILSDPEFGIKLLTELKSERDLRKQVEESKRIIEEENRILSQETVKWADRKLIEALVKKLGYKIGYSEAWTSFKKELLYKHSININLRITNYMNSTGKKTQPKILSMIHDEELQACLSTAVAICKTNNVDISEIIKKFKTA